MCELPDDDEGGPLNNAKAVTDEEYSKQKEI